MDRIVSGESVSRTPANAVVLVGGGGTRLRPLTYSIPKPLVPVVNRPLIAHLLDNLSSHGVRHVVLAAAAGERRIEEALGDGSGFDLDITYAYETTPLGSGLAVKAAAAAFDSPFFVCNGDVITDLDLTELARRHNDHGAILSISLAYVEDPTGYGVVELANEDRITRFVEKPPRSEAPSNWANAGTWLFDNAVLDHIPDEKMDRSLEQLVFPSLIAEGFVVQGFPTDAYWMDVGTAERYRQLHTDLLEGRLRTFLPEGLSAGPVVGAGCEMALGAIAGPHVFIGRSSRLAADARVTGPASIGDDCSIRERAVFERSVAWNGVTVEEGAIVRDSVLGANCWIGAGAVVQSAILADGAMVKRGVRLGPGASLQPGEVAG